MTTSPTSRGYSALVLGGVLAAAGALWRYPQLFGLGAALVLLVGLSLVSVLPRLRLTVRRTVAPEQVHRLAPCEGTLRLSRDRGMVQVTADFLEHVAEHPVRLTMPPLAPGRTTEVIYPIPTQRRGLMAIGPVEVIRTGIAGLAQHRKHYGDSAHVRVLPRILPVQGMPAGATRGQVGAEERVQHGGTDLIGMREYLPGDDLRRLHWATSARTGTLMVREDADPGLPGVTILLDDRGASYRDDGLEQAMDVAASVVTAAVNAGNAVRLRTVSGSYEADSGSDLVHLLSELTAREGTYACTPLQRDDLDVAIVITGAGAEITALAAGIAGAQVGIVTIVDHQFTDGPGAWHPSLLGQATALRGRTAEDLLRLWDTVVAAS